MTVTNVGAVSLVLNATEQKSVWVDLGPTTHYGSLTGDCRSRENHRLQMESFVLKPLTLNLDLIPDLIAASTFFRSVICQSVIFSAIPMRSPVKEALSFTQRKLR